jgi:hypothetical protein
MFSFFRQTFRKWARSGTREGGQPHTARRLECEPLEERTLLSLTGAQLFARSLSSQAHAALSTAPGGRSVVAWETQVSSLDHDIKAQIFDATGHKIGGVLTVAGGRSNQYTPTVAVNANGQFVVAWTTDFTRTDKDIHATLFRANGTRVRSDFPVAWTYKAEYTPKAGIDARGNFDISYTLQYGGADTDVKVAMFNSSATFLRTVDVASTSHAEANAGITVATDGRFAVSYLSAGTRHVRLFSSAGKALDSGVPPPPTPTPPPPATPPLRGTLAGGYLAASLGTGKGSRYDLVGIGNLTGLGEVTVTGDLISTGSAVSSDATGVLTVHDDRGTVRLAVVGPAQGPNAPLPSQFHYTVTAGTGAYTSLHSHGLVNVHLISANHTLTLGLVPVT